MGKCVTRSEIVEGVMKWPPDVTSYQTEHAQGHHYNVANFFLTPWLHRASVIANTLLSN